MSAGMFEGIPDRPDGGEGYEPGVVGFDSSLVERVAGLYLDGTLSGLYDRSCSYSSAERGYGACTGRVGEHLTDAVPGTFSHNLFLDAVLQHTASEIDQASAWTKDRPSWLLTPLVQALYERGFNDFIIAIPEEMRPQHPLGWLKGTPETPLRIEYQGNGKSRDAAPYFAPHVEHCHIDVRGLAARDIGRKAVSSVITADCASVYGNDARSCEFHIHAQGFTFPDYATLCSFFAHGTAAEPELPPRQADSFFWYGNRLLYPGADGSWQEVLM